MIHNILKYKAAHPIGGSDTEEEDDEGSDTEEEDNEGSDGDDMDVIESEDKEGTDEERDEDAASEADSEEDEDTNGDEVEDDLAPGELEEFNELAVRKHQIHTISLISPNFHNISKEGHKRSVIYYYRWKYLFKSLVVFIILIFLSTYPLIILKYG